MRSAFAVTAFLVALTLAGCKGNSLEGKWNVKGVQGMPAGTTATYEFAGGQAKMLANIEMPQMGAVVVNISGPYKIEGDKLTLSDQKVQIDDSKLNPQAKQMIQSLGVKAQMESELKKPQTYTFKFDSSDQVLMTGKQGNATLTRVK